MTTLSKNRQKFFLLSIITVLISLYVLPTQLKPTNFVQDDSYFYLQVASNILNGHGSTFHKITPTNGYHPLWMLFSILGLFVARGDKMLALHIIFGIQALLFLGTAFYFYKIAKLIALRSWIVGLALLAAYFFGTSTYGSEAHLNGFLLTGGIYYFLLAFSNDRVTYWIRVGILLGLSVLARLDNVFVVASLCCFAIFAHPEINGKKGLKYLLALTVPLSGIVMPYLIYNFFSYGHFVPISGSIKSTFPVITANIDNLGSMGKLAAMFGILSLILSFGLELDRQRKTLLRAMGVGVLLHAGYVVLFTNHYTFWPWYYVSGVVNATLVITFVLERIVLRIAARWRPETINQVAMLFAILLAVAGFTRGWLKAYNLDAIGPLPLPKINEYRWPDEVAIWMEQNLPPESKVLVYDWPGAIAYYSDLSILPMDGLMNDYRYNDDLIELGIEEYLCLNNVDFFFGPINSSRNESQEIEVYAPLYRKPAGKIQLLDSNVLVRVRDVVNFPQDTPPYAIWTMEDVCSDLTLRRAQD